MLGKADTASCNTCGGFMFNSQRYMHRNDVYLSPTTAIQFPHAMKIIFDKILRMLQWLHGTHPHHFTLDLKHLQRIFVYRYIPGRYSFPVTVIELEYMFDTLGFLWLHHDSPSTILKMLETLSRGLVSERCGMTII